MTKVTLLIFGEDRIALARVKNTITSSLNIEFLKRNVKAGGIYWSEKHDNYTCYIEVEVGRELGSIPIPEGFYDKPPEKPVIVLREAKEDASDR